MIEHGDCHDGVSLPLGTLRLPALRGARARRAFRKAVEKEMAKAGWAAAHPGTAVHGRRHLARARGLRDAQRPTIR